MGTQQYGQPAPYSHNPPKVSDPNYTFDQAFKLEKPKYNDLWAGILLLLFFGGFVAVSALAIRGYVTRAHGGGIYGNNNSSLLNNNTITLIVLCLALGFLLSLGYLALAKLFPTQCIWTTVILSIAGAICLAIFYLHKQYWSTGITFLLVGLFLAFALCIWSRRIPFSALMLKTTINVSKEHGQVYMVSMIGGIVALALSAWFLVTLTAIYVSYKPSDDNPHCAADGCSGVKFIGLTAFISFTMFWVSEWLKNTIHTTIAGFYGAWFFSPAGQLPKGVMRGSARRALTYSFGSISLGSLIISVLRLLRYLCSVATPQEGGVLGMAFCIVKCVVVPLEWAIRYFNKYAFCHIVLYGKCYLYAAKDTWHLIKDRGLDAAINDCFIGAVLSSGAMIVGFTTALSASLYFHLTVAEYEKDVGFASVIILFAFVIALQVGLIFTTPISSGVDTIFVAAAWDPQVMMTNHTELYREMVALNPKFQQAVAVSV